MKRIILSGLLYGLTTLVLFAQNTNLAGVINAYAAVQGIDTCSGIITVENTVGFEVNMDILLYQAQGATIQEADNAQYGDVIALNGAGKHEVNTIKSINGNNITLQYKPANSYNIGGKVQMVSFPRYTEATVVDTLKCMPWNGSTGGIIALQVGGNLLLQKPISAQGAGFRGGIPFFDEGGNNCNWAISIDNHWYGAGNWRAGRKGEGIAITTVGKECGRGKQANGGGGGNDHNTGGGGGSNNTAGGKGGNNEEPSLFGCDGNFPGNAGRLVISGVTAPQLLLMGGGGGAGHANNSNVGAGGHGGGIIIIKASSIEAQTGAYISANGLDGALGLGDGAGGGGGGGAIILQVTNGVTNNVPISANGGHGGDTDNSNVNRCFGPGGGGSGGTIFSFNPALIPTPLPGNAGKVTQSTNGCNGSTNSGTNGALGLSLSIGSLPSSGVVNEAPISSFNYNLIGNTASFTATASNYQSLYWVFNGSEVLTSANPTFTFAGATGTAQLCAVGICDTVCSQQTITLAEQPNAAFEVPDTLVGCSAIQASPVNNSSNANGFAWSMPGGNPSTSTLPNPTITYANSGTYTITLIAQNGTLSDTTQQSLLVDIETFPSVGFSYVVSGNGAVQFNNTSTNVSDFSWNFGDQTPISAAVSPTHTFAQSGTYTVTLTGTNICGAGVFQQTLNLMVTSTQSHLKSANWKVFPNPSAGQLSVEHVSDSAQYPEQLRLYNALGQIVWEQKGITTTHNRYDISGLSNGSYLLELLVDGDKMMFKVVVAK